MVVARVLGTVRRRGVRSKMAPNGGGVGAPRKNKRICARSWPRRAEPREIVRRAAMWPVRAIDADAVDMSVYAKRVERGRFLWPSPADGIVAISAAQLAYMLDGIDWRNPVRTWRPEAAG